MEDHHERVWMIFERGTICGKGGPSGAILGPGDHLWQEKLPQMVRGTNFGGTIGGIIDNIPLIWISNALNIYIRVCDDGCMTALQRGSRIKGSATPV